MTEGPAEYKENALKPTFLKASGLSPRVVASLAVMALAWAPAGADARGAAQGEPQEQIEELSRVLGVTSAEIEALSLSPEEMQRLLAGFTTETVVVGSRGQPRTVTASPVPVDVLSPADLTSQGTINLQDQLRTVVPSFNVNTQPISDASTVVRPAMLRNLAPDHTLVLVNGPDTPTSFKLGSNRQREVALHADVSYAATDMIK